MNAMNAPMPQERAKVVVFDCQRYDYPSKAPFHPPEEYPEYPFKGDGLDTDNYVYASMREILKVLGWDRDNFGTTRWNPLGRLIKPGDNVVIKPNLVISEHKLGERGLLASVAHGAILRPLIDYAYIANQGKGSITICDSPIKEVDFHRITDLIGAGEIVRFYATVPGAKVHLLDLRDVQVDRDRTGVMTRQHALPGDPKGYTIVDLGANSLFSEIERYTSLLRSTANVYEQTIQEAHSAGRHLYSISNTVLEADVVINLAKLKTHCKTGVTLSLKNMVGITNEKRWLPHHRIGSPQRGGDTYPNQAPIYRKLHEHITDKLRAHRHGKAGFKLLYPALSSMLLRILHRWDRVFHPQRFSFDWGDGDWYGNDTVWRMVLDLNMIVQYANRQGVMCNTRQRHSFAVVDGILGGHRYGPLHPEPVESGILLAGLDPPAVDIVACRLMGFDPFKIPLLRNLNCTPYSLGVSDETRIDVVSNSERWLQWMDDAFVGLGFQPSGGWCGHVER
jgi:uncharacterized protein (DUF362 family)